MPVDPVAALSGTLLNVINAEFAYDNITAYSDKLHESMGLNGIEVGVSPISTRPKPGMSTSCASQGGELHSAGSACFTSYMK